MDIKNELLQLYVDITYSCTPWRLSQLLRTLKQIVFFHSGSVNSERNVNLMQ